AGNQPIEPGLAVLGHRPCLIDVGFPPSGPQEDSHLLFYVHAGRTGSFPFPFRCVCVSVAAGTRRTHASPRRAMCPEAASRVRPSPRRSLRTWRAARSWARARPLVDARSSALRMAASMLAAGGVLGDSVTTTERC